MSQQYSFESTKNMNATLRKEMGFENYSYKVPSSVLPAKTELNEEQTNRFLEFVSNVIYSGLAARNEFRFFAHVLSQFDRRISYEMNAPASVTLDSTWINLHVNPWWLFAMTDTIEEIQAVFMHEVYHVVMMHLKRAKDYLRSSYAEPLGWAMDAAINQFIPNMPKWAIFVRNLEEVVGKELETDREFEYYLKELIADGKWQKFKQSRKDNACKSCKGSGKKPQQQGQQKQPQQPKSQDYKDGFKEGVQQYRDERDFNAGKSDGFDQQEAAKQDQSLNQDPTPPTQASEKYKEGFEQGKQDSKDGKSKEESQQGQDQQQGQDGQQQPSDQGQQGDQGQNGQQQGQQQGPNGQPQQGDQGQPGGDQASQDRQQGQQDGYDAAQKADQKGQQGQQGQSGDQGDGQDGQGDGEGQDGQGGDQQGHGQGQGHGDGQGEPCDCCNGSGQGDGGNHPWNQPGSGMSAQELQNYLDMQKDSHQKWEESDKGQKMSNMEDIIRGIVDKAENKSRGYVPGGMQSLIEAMRQEPEIPWQQEFSQCIGSIKVPYRKTNLRKDRRQPHRRELLGRLPDKTIRVAACYDTSGSVSDEELKWGFNELFDILKTVKSEVMIYETDMVVQRVYPAKKASDIDLKPKGRGGTAFTPTFTRIKEDNEKYDAIIYFTDGEGEQKIEAEKCGNPKIFWIITNVKGDEAAAKHLSCSGDRRFCHRVKGLKPGFTTKQ